MKFIIYGFLLVLAYKLINNLSLLIRTNYYSKKYMQYLNSSEIVFVRHVPSVSRLFKSADLEESYFTITEPDGYGYVYNERIPHFVNLAYKENDFISATLRCFEQARQVYKIRLLESFSPLFWVRSIIFLPQNLFHYLGVNSNNVLVKICQLIYWILAPLALAYRDRLYQYISSLLG